MRKSLLARQALSMRTTLTINEDIARQLREIVHESGKSFKQVVNEALRAGIHNGKIAETARPYRLRPVAMGDVDDRYDLNKALELADRLEDEELVRKFRLRK